MMMTEELQLIKEQFKEVIKYSQDIPEPHVDSLFERWEQKKSRFIEAMGGLTYELPGMVGFPMSEEMRIEKRCAFIEWCYEYSWVIAAFFDYQGEGIYEGKTVREYIVDNQTVPIGIKFGKALRKYFTEYVSEEQIEKICIELSKLIQEDKIRGKLVISVHPLDYLSLSENNYNWRSCHALDGEYRAGNLSYMGDDCTVIVYLKGEHDEVLPRFPNSVKWNSKKWRCLFFFDNKNRLIWEGRQYPFYTNNALDIITKKFFERFNYFYDPNIRVLGSKWERTNKGELDISNFEGPNYSDKPVVVDYEENQYIPITTFVADAKLSFHFNDLLKSTMYNPRVMRFTTKSWKNIVDILEKRMRVGHAAKCCSCDTYAIYDSEFMVCQECLKKFDIRNSRVGNCSWCGDRIIKNDDYCYDDEYYCPECFHKLFGYCDRCGDLVSRDYLDENPVDDADTRCYCSYCRSVLIRESKQEEEYPDRFSYLEY